jgi:hypothetical protein
MGPESPTIIQPELDRIRQRLALLDAGGLSAAQVNALIAAGVAAALPAALAGAFPFSNFFALMPGDNAATIAVGAPVLFPQNGPQSTPPAAVRVGAPPASTFTVTLAGAYQIAWQVSVAEPGQLQVAVGGVGVASTVVGRATGTNQIVGNTVLQLLAGDVVSIINPAGNAAALTLTPTAGGTHAVSATLSIRKIG